MPFQTPASGFGKLPEDPNSYLGELVGIIDGPTFKDFTTGEPRSKMAWIFRLTNLDGSPFLDPDGNPPGSPFIATALTNETLGQQSTARKWFAAILNRPVEDGEDPDALIAAAKVPIVMIQFGKSQTNKPKVASISQFTGESTLTDAERTAILATFPEPGDYSGSDQEEVQSAAAAATPAPPDPADLKAAAEKAQGAALAAANAAAAEAE